MNLPNLTEIRLIREKAGSQLVKMMMKQESSCSQAGQCEGQLLDGAATSLGSSLRFGKNISLYKGMNKPTTGTELTSYISI